MRAGRLFLVLALLAGCGGDDVRSAGESASSREAGAEAGPLTLEDDEGRSVTLEEPPRRIVSLVPSATGILLALGLEERLVARTEYDRDRRVAHLPSVGEGLGPSMERVLALEPDLVIRFAGESDRATPRHLDRAGVPHLAVRPEMIGDIRRTIRLLGAAAGREGPADELVRAMDAELDRVARSVEGLPAPRVAFVLGGDPPWVVGPGTFLHELLEVAGGRNVFGDLARTYGAVSVEELVRRDVDVVLAPRGARLPGALDGLPLRRVPEELQSPGHRVGESARTLARILHPGLRP